MSVDRRVIWLATMSLCWLSSIVIAYRSGFNPGLVHPSRVVVPAVYPWLGVGLAILQTLLYSAGMLLIVWRRGVLRAVGAVGVTVAVALLHVITFRTDGPGYEYVASTYSLLLVLVAATALIVELVVSFTVRRSRAA